MAASNVSGPVLDVSYWPRSASVTLTPLRRLTFAGKQQNTAHRNSTLFFSVNRWIAASISDLNSRLSGRSASWGLRHCSTCTSGAESGMLTSKRMEDKTVPWKDHLLERKTERKLKDIRRTAVANLRFKAIHHSD
jgi:hypothetical protein